MLSIAYSDFGPDFREIWMDGTIVSISNSVKMETGSQDSFGVWVPGWPRSLHSPFGGRP